MIVKQGDKYPVTWTVNMDLTGTAQRVIARRIGATEPVELDVDSAAGGVITHTLTGDLEPGDYQVEVEVTAGTQVVTFPTDQTGTRQYDILTVLPDLG